MPQCPSLVMFAHILYKTVSRLVSVLQCAELLTRIQASLTNMANKRERVKILHKKSESRAVLYAPRPPGSSVELYLLMMSLKGC